MKRIIVLSLLVTIITSATALAQFEIGASYELRDEEPKNGFGLRVEKGIFESIPLVDLGLRAHFSYFNEDNNISRDGVSYSNEITNYDFGVAAVGGVSLGLLQPFVTVGLGSETTDVDLKGLSDSYPEQEGDESNFYWNMSAGAKVTVIPLVKPFVEYRYTNKELSEPTLADAQNGRIMFGVLLSF
ncbi:outer membrane beta-barrel protein [Gracilimonas mengyeensis]|uniref:Opacity protein n=1 Tax=Gracilimonas mengyeensis TaxID=1302730 RepID=A0A521DFP6_9BACT|nr:outer membrane beta-barrel protein [Gracilimonas mengyeensis]SMO70438.1 Opacity protein [Gracilimonas mengyeensis]